MMRISGLLFCLVLFLCPLVAGAGAESIGGDVGYYQIDSVPSGAEVHFDGQYRGTTPVTVEVYSTGPQRQRHPCRLQNLDPEPPRQPFRRRDGAGNRHP